MSLERRTIKVWRRLRRFLSSERGAVLPFMVLFLVPTLSLAFLMVDLSRFLNLQSQMQKAADGFALAAAAELDGSPAVTGEADAITRANNAIDAMLAGQNSSLWGPTITVTGRTYYSSLSGTDAAPGGTVTADPTKARFVRVVVASGQFVPFISPRLFGSDTQLSTGAMAVAGFSETVCRFTPMYVCNPVEGSGQSIFEAAADPSFRRREMSLKQGPNNTSSCPGNFGYLTVGDNGAKALREALAAINPGACYTQNGVVTKPGNITSASDALNTRFDLYEGSAKSMSNATYPPDVNVRKGYNTSKPCKQTAITTNPALCTPTSIPKCNYRGFTADFNPSAMTLCGGTVGNGLWDVQGYWYVNHGSMTPPNGWTNANPPARQDLYQYEISNNLVTDASPGGETGMPVCNAPGKSNRRVLYAAIINCTANSANFNGTSKLPVEAFGKFFLTRPVASDNTVYAELMGIVQPNDASGVVHDDVQLYR